MRSKHTNSNNNTPLIEKSTPLANDDFSTITKTSNIVKKTKIVLLIIVICLLFFTVVCALIYISFSGGIDVVLINLKSPPDSSDPSLVADRNQAISDIKYEFSIIEKTAELTPQVSSPHDGCYEGQNNWKRSDGYAYGCDVAITRYYGKNNDFRSTMLDLEKDLNTIGWEKEYDTVWNISYVIDNYYDKYYGKDTEVSRKLDGKYSISELPNLYNLGVRNDVYLGIDYTDSITDDPEKPSNSIGLSGSIDENIHKVEPEIKKLISTNSYVLVISLEKNYYLD